jgi:hypothetical protein
MNTYEIEVKVSRSLPGQSLYIEARSEKEAVRKAKTQAKKFLSATAIRFASFIVC